MQLTDFCLIQIIALNEELSDSEFQILVTPTNPSLDDDGNMFLTTSIGTVQVNDNDDDDNKTTDRVVNNILPVDDVCQALYYLFNIRANHP